MKCSFECFIIRSSKIPGLRDHVPSVGYPDVGTSVVAGPLTEPVSVRERLEQAGFLFLEAKACVLGGIVEYMGDCITPSVAIPSTWAD